MKIEELTIGEIQTMLEVIQGFLCNCRTMQEGIFLQQSTIYNIEDNDKETMEKFITCLKQMIEAKQEQQ